MTIVSRLEQDIIAVISYRVMGARYYNDQIQNCMCLYSPTYNGINGPQQPGVRGAVS